MKRKIKVIQKTFSLDEVDELRFLVVITRPEFENALIERIGAFGGRTFFVKKAEGVSKEKKIEMLGIQPVENIVVFSAVRSEDATNILVALNSEFNFSSPGCGLGFIVDVDGFMGAKGLFLK